MADEDTQCARARGRGAYRVESHVPELGQESVGTPEPRSLDVGRRAEDHRGDGEDDVDSEADAGTGFSRHGLSDDATKNLAAKVGKLVEQEGDLADLAVHVAPAVKGRGSDALGPDNEHEGDVVGPPVNTVEEPVAELCAVGQGQ